MIDPILPLSISIAEGMGTYAIFLGSGTSRPSGIPTGGDILQDAIKVLFKLENSVEEADDDEINEWFNESAFKDYTYSNILEELCPSREERRKFLERHFEGKHPTESHYLIADLVKRGLVKVIVTTNFDRLMEDALRSKDIPYTIISSDEELETSHPREHSNCWVLKLHGDYKRLNIKNTAKELEKLGDGIEKEFQEIVDRYGLIVMGYSGSDEGVMSCLGKRNSKYTLYWLTRETPISIVKELVEQKEGKVIRRRSAEDFLKELSGKIQIFQVHKTGETPEFIINQIIEQLKDNDEVSLLETIKNQWKGIREAWYDKYLDLNDKFIESRAKSQEEMYNVLEGCFTEFEEYCNVITAIGLVLIEFPNDLFLDLLKILQRMYNLSSEIFETELEEHGHTSHNNLVTDILKAAIHNVYYCLGAYALKEEKFDKLGILLRQELVIGSDESIQYRPIWSTDVFFPKTFQGDTSVVFDNLIESYLHKDFLKDYFYSNKEFRMYLYQMNLILCLYSSKIILENPETRFSNVFPQFSRSQDLSMGGVKKLLYTIRSQRSFAESLTRDALGESMALFMEQYSNRCHYINRIISENITDPFMAFNNLPCDLF